MKDAEHWEMWESKSDPQKHLGTPNNQIFSNNTNAMRQPKVVGSKLILTFKFPFSSQQNNNNNNKNNNNNNNNFLKAVFIKL